MKYLLEKKNLHVNPNERFFSGGILACLVLLVASLGCSGSSDDPSWAKRVKASGLVTYQGKPVEGAEVTFINADKKHTGTAKTDSSGRFTLTTFSQNDGVVPGKQTVTIRRVDVIDKTPANVDLSAGGVAVPPEIKWIIPEKFSLPAKSGLSAEVKEGEKNDFVFDLK